MEQILNYFGIGGIAVIILSVFFEITPIPLNPIQWIGKRLNSDLKKDINKISNKLDDHIVKSYRNDILNFQDELLFSNNGVFTRERWNTVIDSCDKYNKYIEDNNLTNGQVEEATKYIKASYQEALKLKNFKDVPNMEERNVG